jgi:hypothetical protein
LAQAVQVEQLQVAMEVLVALHLLVQLLLQSVVVLVAEQTQMTQEMVLVVAERVFLEIINRQVQAVECLARP